MYRRKKPRIEVKIENNDHPDESPFRFTFYWCETPLCDVSFNYILERMVVDTTINTYFSRFTEKCIFEMLGGSFKVFKKIFDPAIVNYNNSCHYKRKEYAFFGIKGTKTCRYCNGKGKGYFDGYWEDTHFKSGPLLKCEKCNGTGIRNIATEREM